MSLEIKQNKKKKLYGKIGGVRLIESIKNLHKVEP